MKQKKVYRNKKTGKGKKVKCTGFKKKLNLNAFTQAMTEYKVILVCVVLMLVALVVVSCMTLFSHTSPEPERYELEAISGEVDFDATQVKAHTAADGIAVVGTVKTPDIAEPMIAELSTEPAKFIADPAAIWQDSDNSAPTHGGFTMPVQMDDESIGILSIPDIGLTVRVYESGNEMEDMTKGAAHFKSTSAWIGNIGLSAHNVNFDGTAGYFLNLYKLQKGAVIRYETALGKREYVVESVKEIAETDWSTLGRTDDNRITLITCITGKPSMRLSVQASEK